MRIIRGSSAGMVFPDIVMNALHLKPGASHKKAPTRGA